ncbi:Flp pilus assembly protein CpaB [Hankyongella ginsenosidimutans]|uniref:Flp pilus assembly protein CpaB n=1 Tax=Hankyongella ginsenosidimutans TaxID=1763828 RepID=A0A4D7C851_9SPHN|nr:Flp pilus assembly protein CpaB [Hankyongella ginsenosidimutans]
MPSAGLVGPGERGFLAAALQPGMRAITISISDTSGVAGFVFPGDRVDLVLTHQVDQGDRGQIRVSETVLQNVRVLAIDQDVNDREDQPKVGRTVTLEVTPKLVEKIAVMQLIGSVSLSLRSLPEQAVAAAAHDAAAPDPVALAASARVATDKAGKPAKTPVAASIKRDPKMPWDDVQTYTLGKEVSKFASAVRTNSDAGSAPVSAAPAAPAPAASAPKPSGPSIIVNRGAETTQVAAGALIMRKFALIRAGLALGLVLACVGPQLSAAPAVQNASNNLTIGVNKGVLLRLDRAAANVFIANPKVADIQIKSSRLIYVFGTGKARRRCTPWMVPTR